MTQEKLSGVLVVEAFRERMEDGLYGGLAMAQIKGKLESPEDLLG